MEIDIHPDTVAFLVAEFDDMLQHLPEEIDLEEIVFEDLANLLNLLAYMERGSTIHVNL